jgi:hypothetical protein
MHHFATYSQEAVRLKESAVIYVGEGLLPVPAKLAEKIVEMGELLPQFWTPSAGKDPLPRRL